MEQKLLLIGIILLAFVLRFYSLDSYPALNADEAAIGYNAYSLLETGRDEHGNPWPVHFQSFNDFKPGFYFYIVLPFIKVLGLNEWAVRLPGATVGLLTVIVVYFLAREIFAKDKFRFPEIAAFFLAVSPWHIHFSRGGWEVNVATFFISLGVLLMLKAFKNKKWYWLSALCFIASLYTYHSSRVIVPLLVIGISVLNARQIIRQSRTIIVVSLMGLILLIPLVKDLSGEAGISRASGVGLFADMGPLNRVNEQRGQHDDFSSLPSKVLHNKPVNYALAFLQNWSEHFWGEFLFLSGDDIQRNKVPETGQLYLIEVVFVLVGIVLIIRKKEKWGPILLWLGVSPVAAALTFQSPHALRSHNMVIPLTLISAYGLSQLLRLISSNIRNKFLVKVGMLILASVISLSVLRYLHMYWVHMSKEYPFSSQYGLKELVEYVKTTDKDRHIVITDRYDQPYILFLFYLKYPPQKFQNNHELTPRDQYGFSTVREFDKYTFRSITDWDNLREEYKHSLIAGTDEEIFYGTNVVKRIYGSNGYLYFEVVAN